MLRAGRVYLDLCKSDIHGNIPATLGTTRDLQRLGIDLVEGTRVAIYYDDVDSDGRDDYWLGEATAVFDSDSGRWTFKVDEATLRHESDEPPRDGEAVLDSD